MRIYTPPAFKVLKVWKGGAIYAPVNRYINVVYMIELSQKGTYGQNMGVLTTGKSLKL